MIAAAAAAESLSYKKRSTNSWNTKSTRSSLETTSDRQVQFSDFYKCRGLGKDMDNHMQKEMSRLPILIKVERSFGELEEAAASLMAIKFGHCYA
jgi:hypothetical protein